MEPIEMWFKFIDTDDPDYHIIVNAKKFYNTLKDLNGWLNKTIKNNEYMTQDFDKETLEYVHSKIHEILMNYGITM